MEENYQINKIEPNYQESPVVTETQKIEVVPENNSNRMKIIAVIVVVAGIASGYLLSKNISTTNTSTGSVKVVNTAKEVGVTDQRTYKDTATGVIEKNTGTVSSEGTHKLIRNPGDESQTAYLTSSVVDLDQFIGKKVEVWGETFTAQHAAWLMDVGKVTVLE